MKKLIKIGCMLLVMALLITSFVSCTNTPDTPDTPKETDASATSEPTAEPEEYDVTKDPKVFQDELPRVTGNYTQHISITPNDGTGFDVYAPLDGKWGYRYAPSIIYYPDGSMDAWFATPGTTGEWDWFTYKHSDDGGKTWTNEKIVLQPTPDSYDHYSVCDPGMIYFGGYYYLGYTSTIVNTNGGINNNVFVARSKNPDGPFEKWNGTGWGGDPAPIVYFNENDEHWGAGEPSFVELDGKIYMYYTWNGDVNIEMVMVGDSTNENWPATLVDKGRAFTNSGGDQCDAVYIEDIGKFIMVQTYNRFTETSGVQIWESVDGIHFIKGEFSSKDIAKYCHNMGIAKRSNGHIQLKDTHMIGYAYAQGGNGSNYWGKWPTRFVFVDITVYEGNVDKTDKGKEGVLIKDYYWEKPSVLTPVGLTTLPHLVKLNVGTTLTDFAVYWIDSTISKHEITDASLLKFFDYDTSLIKFDGTKIIGLKEGKTNVSVTYEGITITFKVYVYAEGFEFDQETPEVTSISAVQPEITVYLGKSNGGTHKPQVRTLVKFADDTWGEAYNDSNAQHPDYQCMVPIENYKLKFTSSNESVVKVSTTGILTAKALGDAVITVELNGKTCTCTVHVVEPPAELNWKDKDFNQ